MAFIRTVSLAGFCLITAAAHSASGVNYDISYYPAVCSQADYDKLPADKKKRAIFAGVNKGTVDAIAIQDISVGIKGDTLKVFYRTKFRYCVDEGKGRHWQGSSFATTSEGLGGAVIGSIKAQGYMAPMRYFVSDYTDNGFAYFSVPLSEFLDAGMYRKYMGGERVDFAVNLYHGVPRNSRAFDRRDLLQFSTRNNSGADWIYGGYRQFRLSAKR